MSNAVNTEIAPFKIGDFERNSYVAQGGYTLTGNPTGTADLALNNNTLIAKKQVVFARFNSAGVTRAGVTTSYLLMWSHYGTMPYIPGRDTIRAKVRLEVTAACTLRLSNGASSGTVGVPSGSVQEVEVTTQFTVGDTVTYLEIKADAGTADVEVFSIELLLDPLTSALTVTDNYVKNYFIPIDTSYYTENAPLSVPFLENLITNNKSLAAQTKKVVSSYFGPFSVTGGSLGEIELTTLAGDGYDVFARMLYFRKNNNIKKLRVRLSAYTDSYVSGDGGYVAAKFKYNNEIVDAYLPFDIGSLEDLDAELLIPNGFGPHELVFYGCGDATNSTKVIQWVVEEV